MNYTKHDIEGIIGAVKTREALEQADMHVVKGNNAEETKREQSLHVPVMNQKGEVFAGQFIKKNFALVLPPELEPETVVEFKDKNNQYHYGLVIKTKKPRQSEVRVKEINKQEASELRKDHKVKSLSQKDLKELGISESKLATLLQLIDPAESLVLKLFSFLLMKDVFDKDSVSDIFVSVYLRILAIAALMIMSAYFSTFFL